MKHFILLIIILSITSCSGGGAGVATTTRTDSPLNPSANNMKLMNTALLEESIWWYGDFDDPTAYATVTVMNQSLTETYICYVKVTTAYTDVRPAPQVILPRDTISFDISLKDLLSTVANTVFVDIEIDYNDMYTESDETDNSVRQQLWIRIPPAS